MKTTIRPWKIEDAKELSSMLSNPKILDNLRDGLPYPYTVKDGEDYIRAMLAADPNDTFAFAIEVGSVCVGSIGVFRGQNIHSRTAELGYYLAEPYWGKGIMTEAVKATCARVFEVSDILRIYAEPFSRNLASCRVLEKAGFSFEGTMRANAVKNGITEDMKLYALLSPKLHRS